MDGVCGMVMCDMYERELAKPKSMNAQNRTLNVQTLKNAMNSMNIVAISLCEWV